MKKAVDILKVWGTVMAAALLAACVDKAENAPGAEEASYNCAKHLMFGMPGPENEEREVEQVLCRQGYVVGYDYSTKSPTWVMYHITAESVAKRIERVDNFREDPEIPEYARATLEDYKGSGYDRGHMAPYATIDFSEQSASESFLLTNITPQHPSLNRGPLAELEQKVRECVAEVGELHVTTGALFLRGGPKIGNRVYVPVYIYKVIMDTSGRSIAYLLYNDEQNWKELSAYAIPVGVLEDLFHVDIAPKLPDIAEEELEDKRHHICQALDFEDWPSELQ